MSTPLQSVRSEISKIPLFSPVRQLSSFLELCGEALHVERTLNDQLCPSLQITGKESICNTTLLFLTSSCYSVPFSGTHTTLYFHLSSD